ncbi:MAG: 50S ribosomal protein L25/general stress protein Ctc [Rhodospirillaceae bacterium]|nr:50S ribosomal protein L25/general stress protein Ctc [Rhodospirillaceae bacterium]|tara:strand:+ start:1474 stop:2148 length:675 start_codon:yes stop_codon:yes gene_type:complete
MTDITVLTANAREKVGKGSAREARRQGNIPAVIYGDKKSPIPIVVEQKILVRHLSTGGFFNTLFDIDVNGELNRVLPRDVQLHPVTDVPEHVDFLRVSATTKVSVEVPVEFIGDDVSPGIKSGGVLNVVRYTVEVSCTPDLIPNTLLLDLSSAEIGDSLHISAVNLPEGVTPTISDRDFTIATIVAPTVVRDEATSDDESDSEDTETEATAESTEENSEAGSEE